MILRYAFLWRCKQFSTIVTVSVWRISVNFCNELIFSFLTYLWAHTRTDIVIGIRKVEECLLKWYICEFGGHTDTDRTSSTPVIVRQSYFIMLLPLPLKRGTKLQISSERFPLMNIVTYKQNSTKQASDPGRK